MIEIAESLKEKLENTSNMFQYTPHVKFCYRDSHIKPYIFAAVPTLSLGRLSSKLRFSAKSPTAIELQQSFVLSRGFVGGCGCLFWK